MLWDEGLDDGHRRTTVPAGEGRGFFVPVVSSACFVVALCLDRLGVEQGSGAGEVVVASSIDEEPAVADPMEAFRQDVLEEAADELVGGERHGLPAGLAVAIVLIAEGHAAPIEG
jgi:hypothetical protein